MDMFHIVFLSKMTVKRGSGSAKTHITDAVQVPGNLTQPVEFHRHLNTTLTV